MTAREPFRVGMIGFGAIGAHVARALAADAAFRLDYVVARDRAKVEAALPGVRFLGSPEDALAHPVDLVVEAATPPILEALLPALLAQGDVLPFSLTPLADRRLEAAALKACAESGRRLFVSPGAILGLDGISAARDVLGGVTIRTTKTPRSLGLPDRPPGSAPETLFDGPAREACRRFSRNVNVHAALALAGLGFDATRSVVVADPGAKAMRHEISIEGRGLSWAIRVESPAIGAVSGAFVPRSALASVRRVAASERGLVVV